HLARRLRRVFAPPQAGGYVPTGVCVAVPVLGGPAIARCASKNATTLSWYSAPATVSAWLCLALGTTHSSFRPRARSNSAFALSGLMYGSPSPWIIRSGRLNRPTAFSTLG